MSARGSSGALVPQRARPPCRAVRVGGCVGVEVREGEAGVRYLRSTEALQPYPRRLSDVLTQWAREAPDRCFVARRTDDGAWRRITYAEMAGHARALGQALLAHGATPARPLVVLSGNDLEHAMLMMAAFHAGVPCVSVSPAYSLVSKDFAKLRHVVQTVAPGLVYAAGPQFAAAIDAGVPAGVPVVLGQGRLDKRASLAFDELLRTAPGPEVDAAHAATGPDTVAKILFTSGSTQSPKGVVTTHRMLCANQQMLRQCMAFLADEPPVLMDWLPWSHTFGGNHNLGIALYNGGTYYIDDGRPTPQAMATTLRNLREIAPTVYFNVPKGFEELARAMETDDALRDNVFSRAQAFMFAAAGLSQAVWDQLDALGARSTGERVRILTGLGMTETAPTSTFDVGEDARSGDVGLPCPGVEVKLVPVAGKLEIRFRGPHVMPGYHGRPDLTAAAFDEEGFYRTGDAVTWIAPGEPGRGLRFDGRIAEDFKLSTGTFVSVGPLRARAIALGHPCVQDVVVAGENRDDLAALVFPRLVDCARLAGLPEDSEATRVFAAPAVQDFFARLADRLWEDGTGSANRVARLALLAEPPDIDGGELTDKNSINQRAVLARRAALVAAVYEAREAASEKGLFLPMLRARV